MEPACQRLELLNHDLPGVFITFCGVDGSGKSSLIKRVERSCREANVPCLVTATPTARIREDRLFRELVDDPLTTADWSHVRRQRRVSVLGLLLSIMGDLVQHTTDTILPALERGEVVLCDRYVFTSHAEIVARSSLAETQPVLASIARRMIRPNVAFGLDISAETSARRVLARQNMADRPPPTEFLARQVDAYRRVFDANALTRLDCEAEASIETTSRLAISEVARHCSDRLGMLDRHPQASVPVDPSRRAAC
jgi:dTMP kinase